MSKSTIVKWAVAALLAIPAGTLLAKPAHHAVTASTHVRRTLATSKKHHRYHHLVRRHTALSSKSARAKHVTASVRHTVHRRTLSSARPTLRVHVTHMPPTIDGIHT